MKNLFIGCVMLVAALAITSCNRNGRTTAKRTVIDGKITNLQLFPNTKEFTLEVADFGGAPTTYKTTIHKDGTFKIYFDQYIAQDVKITPLIRTFIAHPGDSIHIDLDYKLMGDVKFSGDGEKTNTDINHYTSEYFSTYNNDNEKLYFRTMDTANYRAVCENMKVEMLKHRAEFIDKYQPNDEVKKWTKNYVNIRYYRMLINFLNYYNVMQAAKNKNYTPILLNGYAIAADNIGEIYNTDILNADSYSLLGVLMPRHAAPKYKYDYNEIIKARIPLIEKAYKNSLLKQMLTGDLFYVMLRMNDAEDFDKNKASFDDGIQAAFIKQPLLKYYTAVKKNLANAKINSDAILKDMAGTPAKGLIDAIKNQNKGKVIYIDFWATWCGPCKAEMPYTEKMIEKYKGKDVAFVFLCVQSPKDTWKLNLANLKLSGIQYFCDQPQSASLSQAFHIMGIPYHILINKNGDIAENGNILSSRDPLTEHKIDRLLN